MKGAQLEILLFTDTSFSSQQFSEKYDSNRNNSPKKKSLEEACWSGLFPEILPELYEKVGNVKKLVLWKVARADHFLELEYGVQPEIKDKFLSTNPYFFLGLSHLS